jgi:YggT family protein
MLNDIYLLVLNAVFGIAVGILILRIWLQLARLPFNNPVVQQLYLFLAPILRPFEKVIPRFRNFNIAAVVLCYLVCLLWAVLATFDFSALTPLIALGRLINSVFYTLWFAAIAYIVMSFIPGGRGQGFGEVVNRLVNPLVRPIQRRMPMIGPFDFSIAVLILFGLILYRVWTEVFMHLVNLVVG